MTYPQQTQSISSPPPIPPLPPSSLICTHSLKSIVKAGGRVFDISVDILDPVAGAIVADLNYLTSLELKIEPTLVEVSYSTIVPSHVTD